MSNFLCPALPNRPHQTVVVVNGGQVGLSQTPYLQNWPKSAFEIVVRVSSNEGASGKTAPKQSVPQVPSIGRMVDREAKRAEGKGIGYVCASYRKKTTSCTIHFIRTEIVRDLILDALRNVATYARANKEDFEQLVMQTTSDARRRSLQSGRTELDRIMRRTNELDTLLQKLYEDYALGRLPEKRHAKLSAQYEAEQAQLEQRSAELMEQMNAEQEESVNVDRFMELVDRYTDFTELTTPMLNEFIDKVIVYERRKINRYQYDQRIEIYFNFIGKVTLPEEETEAAPEAPKTLHVATNSSFAPIGDYLSAQTVEAIALPFSKVEELTGKPLCKSAYKYASYWYPAQDRPLSNTIYNAGYDVDRVDLAAGIVYLTRAA